MNSASIHHFFHTYSANNHAEFYDNLGRVTSPVTHSPGPALLGVIEVGVEVGASFCSDTVYFQLNRLMAADIYMINDSLDPEERRRFKTYGRKKGFLNPKEELWLQNILPSYELPHAKDRKELLQTLGVKSDATQLWLEIGFGNGIFLTHLALQHPADRLIGVEVFMEGISALIRRLERENLTNVRVIMDSAYLALLERIPPASLDRVVVNFPDPWPKKKHHKRRLIQSIFLDLLASRMRDQGLLTLATDWAEYAEWMLFELEKHPLFRNEVGVGLFAPPPQGWIETRFQQKGHLAGRATNHLAFRRV